MNNNVGELYKLYGFNEEKKTGGYSIYTYDQGYFHNAEIVVNGSYSDNRLEVIKEDLTNTGYSVSVKKDTSYEMLSKDLFSGFFKVDYAKKRVVNEYELYKESQTKRYGDMKYAYIKSSYTVDGKMQSDDDILIKINNLMNGKKKHLVILEAPAGFGKTCTSYEMSNILANKDDLIIPMLMELSKNRRASIFRYVLLDEINANFNLPYELVVSQIKAGKIPLIIDGFDELLSRSDNDEGNNDDALTMLDTISEILEGDSNAKILLTSRKSSIFAGEEFDEWMEKKLDNCDVTRIQILTPTIASWLEKEKMEFFKKKNISLFNVENPVLLLMLKYKPIYEYENDFKEESDILETYINLMFTRERERQQLLLDISEQRKIMRKLSAVMVQFNVSSAEREEIKTMVETVVEDDINRYLKEYEDYLDQDKVSNITQDSFLLKIVNNAMLDRVKVNGNDIGFINEFIFGIFIGEAITNGELSVKDAEGVFLNTAISSFASENKNEKDLLYDKISKSNINLTTEQKLIVGFNLKGIIMHDFVDEYISNFVFDKSTGLENDRYFYNCVFETCTFNGCSIRSNLFEGCHFINCCFYNIKIIESGYINEESVFVSCTGHEKLHDILSVPNNNSDKSDEIMDFKRLVLEQYWMPGSEYAEMKKSYRTLFKGIDPKYRKDIANAIKQLKNEGILKELIHCLELDKSKFDQIKQILGREEKNDDK